MNTLGVVLLTAFVGWFLYGAVSLYTAVLVSKKLVATSVPFTKEGDGDEDILIIGDSTAVGVGAKTPEESLAGLVSSYLNASSVENYAKSGAVTEDLPGQINRAQKKHYALILVQIGGNDIIQLTSVKTATKNLSHALELLPESDKVIVISAGNVGGATILPYVVRPFYTHQNMAYHAAFEKAVSARGFTYTNIYRSAGEVKIEHQPDIYLAADGLHPSSAGYELWFEAIRSELTKA